MPNLVKTTATCALVGVLAVLFAGELDTAAQTPATTASPTNSAAARTPVPSPVVTATAMPLEPERFIISLTSLLNDGLRLQIPAGTELIARSATGICARVPIDAQAINAGQRVVAPELVIPASPGCGEPGLPLSIELRFPGEPPQGTLLFGTEWEPGLTRTLDLEIPAPVHVPSAAPRALPSTGGGGDPSDFGVVRIAGVALILAAIALPIVVVTRRRSRS